MVSVIAGGPMLIGDSNKARKNYGKYAMTSSEILYNIPTAKGAKTRQVLIMWIKNDEDRVLYPYKDAVVIKANVANKEFNKILVDSGSSVDVLFKSALEEMRITNLSLEHTNTSLKGFGRGRRTPLGVVELPVMIRSRPFEKTMMLDFVVVEEDNAY